MTRTHVAGLVLIAAVGVGGAAATRQASPDGTPPLQSYHIHPGDLPGPTDGTANPPMVVEKPADASLHLPAGFKIDYFLQDGSDFKTLRNLMEGENGEVFAADATANTITVLQDTDGDGKVDEHHVFAEGLDRPFGMAIAHGYFYVGNTGAVVRWKYTPGQKHVEGQPETVTSVPSGGGHWTRNLAFSPDQSKLFVSVGSASNVDAEAPPRASILEMNPDGSDRKVYASGLRNPVNLAVQPGTGQLWTCVNERDMLGEDLVPDYVTHVQEGAFYGWPYAYIGQHEDPRRKGEHPELVQQTVVPDVLLQSHSAPLGMVFYTAAQFPAEYKGDAFVALHGSWNRKLRTGYKVVRVRFDGTRPTGEYDDFIAGWSLGPAQPGVWGRPVSIVVHKDGSLLISDDAHNVIWRVTYSK